MTFEFAKYSLIYRSVMFFEKLGGDIFVLVSEFQNYPCIGIRKCLFIKKTGKIIVGKEGVNLMIHQYRNLKLHVSND